MTSNEPDDDGLEASGKAPGPAGRYELASTITAVLGGVEGLYLATQSALVTVIAMTLIAGVAISALVLARLRNGRR